MNRRAFGKTGIEIPEIGMGCWAIGGQGYGPVSEPDALDTLQAAWDGGVRLFDTADVYGDGVSEKLIAKFMANKPRGELFIATKGGWDFYQGGHKKRFESGYIRFACEESLKRLQTDYIDLYQLHNPSLEQIREGSVFHELEALKKEGKIRHIGVSVHREDEALEAIQNQSVESIQLIFNVIDQRMARKVFYAAEKKRVAVLAREPLACGILTGKYSADTDFPKGDHRRRYSQEKMRVDALKLDRIKAVLNGLSLPAAALEFVLGEPAISCVIPGAKTPGQVKSNLEKAGLADAQKDALRSLFNEDPLFRQELLPRWED